MLRFNDLAARVDRAIEARRVLLEDPRTTACRLFHDAADGIPGLVVERLGDVLVVQTHEGRLRLDDEATRELCAHAARRTGARAVYRKRFVRDRSAARAAVDPGHRAPTPWVGAPVEPEFPVLELGVRFLVRPYDGFSTGLFLEHRDNRRRMRERAAGRRVLNLFAYTCGYTVAALLGGAARVVSVDASVKSLEWGKRNLAANGIDAACGTPPRAAFIASDVFDYFHRAARQRSRFDLLVLDPPTFARTKAPRRTFSLAADLDRLVEGALGLLEAGGLLLLACNHRGTSGARLERAVSDAADRAGRRVEIVERPALPPDFPADADFARSLWARA